MCSQRRNKRKNWVSLVNNNLKNLEKREKESDQSTIADAAKRIKDLDFVILIKSAWMI